MLFFVRIRLHLFLKLVVGRLEETFRVSLVVEEKPLYLRSSCIFLLGNHIFKNVIAPRCRVAPKEADVTSFTVMCLLFGCSLADGLYIPFKVWLIPRLKKPIRFVGHSPILLQIALQKLIDSGDIVLVLVSSKEHQNVVIAFVSLFDDGWVIGFEWLEVMKEPFLYPYFSYNQRTLSCQWLLAVVQAGPRLRYYSRR